MGTMADVDRLRRCWHLAITDGSGKQSPQELQ
jgi:hypothetical protein